MIMKCKMCGGDLHPAENATTCECEFCGTVQTLPKLNNERRANLYDRANHFRRSNDYDKAMGIFEQILQDDRTDAEAYWSLVLCRYGIEYVEDPATHKRVPTVNRAQFTSIFADEDYKSALAYADAAQRGLYEEEARTIDGIQKGILEISKQEKPFDVFICYKETDAQGKRTPDSVLANDLYHQLTREGFKVFFSRITLEDKLGQQYEPYIFAALNSAKVMVVLGTKPEYFNAVWVKNEWSRYLALIKAGANKTLVPAYKDMDPYDLPEEFSHLQAQDMSKLGFMQDLIHGIKKLTGEDKPAVQPVAMQASGAAGSNVAALLDRAFLALEDGEWDKADDFCEKALNIDARNTRAYIGKLMAERKVRREADLSAQQELLEKSGNYQKALRFADEAAKAQLTEANQAIKHSIEQQQLARYYSEAMACLQKASTVADVEKIKRMLAGMGAFEAAADGVKRCDEKIENMNSAAYGKANDLMKQQQYAQAAKAFRMLGDYRDSQTTAAKCDALEKQKQAQLAVEQAEQRRTEAERKAKEEAERAEKERISAELKAREKEIHRREAEARKAKVRRISILAGIAAAVCVAVVLVVTKVIIPKGNYDSAMRLLDEGQYSEAIDAFAALGGYSDSDLRIQQAQADQAFAAQNYDTVNILYATLPEVYQDHAADLTAMYDNASAMLEAGQFDEAAAAFAVLGGYRDASRMIFECIYRKAEAMAAAGQSEEAAKLYQQLDDYEDSGTRKKQMEADALYTAGNFAEAYDIYAMLDEAYQPHAADYEAMYAAAQEQLAQGQYDEAAAGFAELGKYRDAESMVMETNYCKATALLATGDYEAAIALFNQLGAYKNSSTLAIQAKADALYAAGKFAEAYDIYATLDEAYQPHAADYEAMYATAQEQLAQGQYDEAAMGFAALGKYRDAEAKVTQCAWDEADALFAAGQYAEAAEAYEALGDQEKVLLSTYKQARTLAETGDYRAAATLYLSIADYADSREQHYQMGTLARDTDNLADACAIFIEDIAYGDSREALYQTGILASKAQNYEISVTAFAAVGEYKDAAMKCSMDTYAWGVQLFDNGDYDKSAEVFASMGNFSDAAEKAQKAAYAAADTAYQQGAYDDAAARYDALGSYSDSAAKARASRYAAAEALWQSGDYREALEAYASGNLKGYSNADDHMNDCRYHLGKVAMESGDYTTAMEWFSKAGNYSDSASQANECRYQLALAVMQAGDYDAAIAAFTVISDYGDSTAQIAACHYAKGIALEAVSNYEAAYGEYTAGASHADGAAKVREMAYQTAEEKLQAADYEEAVAWFEKSEDYSDAKEQILAIGEYYYATEQYDLAEAVYVKLLGTDVAAQRLYELGEYYEQAGDLKKAAQCYREAGNYQDAADKTVALNKEVNYQAAEALYKQEYWVGAKAIYVTIRGYKDTDARLAACDNEINYQQAEELYKLKDWNGAKAIYEKICGYKDADSKIKSCDNEIAAAVAAARDAKFTVGNYVTFGTYPQTKAGRDKTPIEWCVVIRQEKEVLLISRYGLDAQPYNTSNENENKWETCTLRAWLNDTFFNEAFNTAERTAIMTTSVDNSIQGGNNTYDKIFLLNWIEAHNFVGLPKISNGSSTSARVAPTAYASSKIIYSNTYYKTVDGDSSESWWLRSHARKEHAPMVAYDGSFSQDADPTDAEVLVRPALWVNIEAEVFNP